MRILLTTIFLLTTVQLLAGAESSAKCIGRWFRNRPTAGSKSRRAHDFRISRRRRIKIGAVLMLRLAAPRLNTGIN